MEPNSYWAVEIAVNVKEEMIVDVACISVPVLCERMVRDYLLGKPVTGTLETLEELLESKYHGIGKRAMIAALGNATAIYSSSSGGRVPR